MKMFIPLADNKRVCKKKKKKSSSIKLERYIWTRLFKDKLQVMNHLKFSLSMQLTKRNEGRKEGKVEYTLSTHSQIDTDVYTYTHMYAPLPFVLIKAQLLCYDTSTKVVQYSLNKMIYLPISDLRFLWPYVIYMFM